MRQRERVQTEMVAQLVGEHARELTIGELFERERRDDDEVAATRERVELVGIDDPEDVPVRRQVRGDGEVAPDGRDHLGLVVGRRARPEQRAQHGDLDLGNEQHAAEHQPRERDRPHGNVDDEADREPEDDHRQEPERDERGHRQ
jgi:hypothetical protein